MQELDIFQHQAVLSNYRNTVVTAPPGSGKTRVIKERVGLVLGQVGVNYLASSIVVITYTNAAACELRERLSEPELSALAFCGTIHGFAKWLIEQYVIGAEERHANPIAVMDEEENMEQLLLTVQKLKLRLTKTAIREVARRTDDPKSGVLTEEAELLYRAHCKWQTENRRYSFAGLIMAARTGLKSLSQRAQFDLIVDEYQDASESTHELLEALPTRSRFYVGDANQSIFGFIGGSPERLLELAGRSKTDPNNWVHVELQNTYRCSQQIVDAANKVVERLRSRTVMASRSERANFDLMLRGYSNSAQENVEIAKEVASLIGTQDEGERMAVICRTNAQCEAMRAVLKATGVRVTEELHRDQLPGLRQALVILDYIANPSDAGRVETVNKLIMTPGEFQATKERALKACQAMTGPQVIGGHGLTYAVSAIASDIKDPSAKIDRKTMLAIGTAEAGLGTFTNASDLAMVLRSPDFGVSETEEESEQSVTVATVHGAKGREWSHVWIVGCNECYWKGSPDEERRLFYVALTRAKEYVSVSWSELCSRAFNGRALDPVQSQPIAPLRELFHEQDRTLPRTRAQMPPELQTGAMNEIEMRRDLEDDGL